MASCRIAIVLLALFVASPALSLSLPGDDEPPSIKPVEASAFPELTYKDVNGEPRPIKPDLGKLTIVHFWATWCAPCVDEIPSIDALQKAYAPKGLKVISISEDGDSKLNDVKKFFASHNITTLPAYLDVAHECFHSAKGRGLPTSFIVDAKGEEIAIVEGPLDWQSPDAKAFIEGHLKP